MKKRLLALFLCLTIASFTLHGESEQILSDTFLLRTGHTNIINHVSRQGDILVTSSRDNTVKLWDLNTGNVMDSFRFFERITSALLTEDGKTLMVTDGRDKMFKVDIASGRTILESLEHFSSNNNSCQSYLHGGAWILVNDSRILAIDTESLEQRWSVEINESFDRYSGSRWNIIKEGNYLLCTDGNEILYINISDGSKKKRALGDSGQFYVEKLWVLDENRILDNQFMELNYYSLSRDAKMMFSQERGGIIYTGGKYFAVQNQSIRLFDSDLKEINTFAPGSTLTESMKVFFPDEFSMVITTPDGGIYFYANPAEKNPIPLVLGDIKITPTDLLIVADKKNQFITAEKYGRTVRSWQTSNGNPKRIYTSEEPIKFLSLNASQDTIFVGTNHLVVAVNLSSMREKTRLEIPEELNGIAFCASRDALVSYHYQSEEQFLSLWFWNDEERASKKIPIEKAYRNVRLFTLDDQYLLLTDQYDFYECYDMEREAKIWGIKDEISNERDLYYGADEGELQLIKSDGKIYRVSTSGEVSESGKLGNYHMSPFLTSVDMSPEASIIAAGTSLGKLLYFDLETNELIHSINAGNQSVKNIFITDRKYGRKLLFSDDTGALAQWTRINDNLKYLSFPLGESAIVLKPVRDVITPYYFGEIDEEADVFTNRNRVVPKIRTSEWELLEDQNKKILRISCESDYIPDGIIVRGSVFQSNGDGYFLKEIQKGLTGSIRDGKTEFFWEPEDCRDDNEISSLWFAYILETDFTERWEGKPIQVRYPEIQEYFWYNNQCVSGEPAILSLVVKDLDPNEKVSLEFFDNKDRSSSLTTMEGFKIGEMEDPIMITRQRFSAAGLINNHLYYLTVHTESGIDFIVNEPVSYQ